MMNPSQSPGLCFAESVLVTFGIAVLCWTIDIPGSMIAGLIISGLMIGYTILDIRGVRIVEAQQRVLAAILFIALVGGIVFVGTLRQRVYHRMAYMQHIAGDPGLALKYYTYVAKHSTTDADRAGVYNNLGDIMARLHDYEEAAAWYRIALEQDPDNGSCHANLALALMTLQQVDEAVTHYKRAIELGFASPAVHYNYAFSLQSASRIDESIEQYRLAVYHNPDMIEAHNNLAVLMLTANRLDEAHHHLREVLRLSPDEVFTMNNLAWMLATRPDRNPADVQEALTIATRAAALTKRQNPVVLGTLAECYFAMGLKKEAVQAAEEAIRVARASGQDSVAAQVQPRLDRYRQ
jgi:tetratricopeptide (TPR) repeat protein